MWLTALTFIRNLNMKYVAIGISLLAAIFLIFRAGENHIQAKWDKENLQTEKQIAELKDKANQITVKTEIQYVDRVKIVTIKGATITQYVDRYITPTEDQNCIIPKNFILLHDSAVTNTLPKLGAPK